MKRKASLLLVFIFIFTLALPLQGYAAEMDKELENAIIIAKTKFTIPEDFTFDSSISTYGTQKLYYLNWRSKDTLDSTNISVTIDDKGTVLEYYRYSSKDYKQSKKLPILSRAEAKAKADEYIEHIAPGLLKDIQYVDEYQDNIMDSSYYLNYHRIVDAIPYYNDRIGVNINRDTGELQNYYRNWTDNLEFPAPDSAISLDEAEKAYTENLGLRLIYSYKYEDNVLTAFPLYAPVYSNNDFAVDAFTGERYRLDLRILRGADGAGEADTANEKSKQVAGGAIQLSPEELEAIAEAGKLIDYETAEKLAREAEFLSIPDDFELQYHNLNASWPDEKEYIWRLQFRKLPSDNKTASSEYISVSVNAKTSEIMSFSKRSPKDDTEKQPINDIEKARADTDAFLAKYYPKYFDMLEYDKIANEGYLAEKIIPMDNYNIKYSRLVNGVPFPDNGVSITYDNLTETIISFSLNWYDMEFPSVNNVIGVEAAAESLFDKVGLGLEYRYDNSGEVIPLDLREQQEEKGKAVLVYLLKSGKPLYIDANTGNIVYKSGDEYKEPKKVSYTDISGHFAEKQISVLADFGIYLDGSEFKPDDAITQKDFLTLISKTLNYYGPIIMEDSTDKDIEEFYAYLIREGIVTGAEKAPDAAVTREEAVKYIIRALKYDKVADLKGIFSIGFEDSDSITEDLYGYVAIAYGLGIVNGDGVNFNPKKNISRGESVVMIYNYLQS